MKLKPGQNDLFRAETERNEKKKGHVGPTQIKEKKKKKRNKKRRRSSRRTEVYFFIFYFFFSLTSLFDIWELDRQNSSGKEAKCSTQRGLRVGTKNTRFRRVFNKNSENPMFWFFLDLRLSDGQNWSEQKVKLIHASRVTHGHQNFGVWSNSIRYGFLPK